VPIHGWDVMPHIDDLSEALDRVPVALYRTAPDGRLIGGNRALGHLLGFDTLKGAVEHLGDVESVYVDPEARRRWVERIEDEGVIYDFDIELRRPDGSTIWVRDSARAIRDEDEQTRYYEGSLVDVTDKIRAQHDRDEFVATASHELRTPITVLVGMGSELAKNYDSFSDEDRRDMAYLIERQAEDAAGIIEDLLVASRDDMQLNVASVEFDLADEVNRVLEVVDQNFAVRANGAPTVVQGDPNRTRQILRNLVSNAIRYGKEPLEVHLSRVDGQVELRVCDSGDRISDADSERIFMAYQRGGGEAHPKSIGLGLGVARRLANLMGGTLEYDHDGEWSSFVLRLPARST